MESENNCDQQQACARAPGGFCKCRDLNNKDPKTLYRLTQDDRRFLRSLMVTQDQQ